jgi:hypothetical protein
MFSSEKERRETAQKQYSLKISDRAKNIKKKSGAKQHYTDYYSVLSLSPDCTQRDIKDRYVKLARTHHPDRNGGRVSLEKQAAWANISLAYAKLRDPDGRSQYDDQSAIRAAVTRFYKRHNPVSDTKLLPYALADCATESLSYHHDTLTKLNSHLA